MVAEIIVIFLLCTCQICNSLDTFKIVGLFHNDENEIQMPFKSVVTMNNLSRRRVYINSVMKSNVPRNHLHDVHNLVCELLENERPIAALFGPPESVEANLFLESLTTKLGLPYIHTTCFYPFSKPSPTVLRFCPKTNLLSDAIAKIVDNLQWFEFTILYEDIESLIKLQEVLKLQQYDEEGIRNRISMRELGPGPDYRGLFKELSNSTNLQYIIDCKLENVLPILQHAAEQNMMGSFKSYFITALDAHTLDIKQYEWEANITTIRITTPQDDFFQDEVSNWGSTEYGKISTQIPASSVKAQAALMNDAVKLFIDTINGMKIGNKHLSRKMSCNGTTRWRYGVEIIENMKQQIPSVSLTGPMEFDVSGDREVFQVELLEANHEKVIATWSSKTPDVLYSNRSEDEFQRTIEEDLKKTIVKVHSRIGPPYLMNRTSDDGEELKGNDRFEGFSIDLIQAISYFVGFKFEFDLNPVYGSLNEKTKQWDGLIRDVMDKEVILASINTLSVGEAEVSWYQQDGALPHNFQLAHDFFQQHFDEHFLAHMAICDLTITKERRSVVDFSMPFMTLGISILMKKPEDKDESKLFAFMNPFGIEVWIYTVTLYLIITISLYFITRLNLADWENPHPCDQENEEVENIWDLKNCLWLSLGSILTQGCDILPKGISSKTAVSMWWFFSLIISSTYTANLAAFMTKSRNTASVDNVEELAAQTKIKYGTVENGATYTFFKGSKLPTYQKIFATMTQSRPSVFCKDNTEGVSKVENTPNGLYAFFMESTQIEYNTETKCNLMQIGNWLDTRRYGIAMPMNAPYRHIISNAVLKLQENGTIEQLKIKWWKTNRSELACDKNEEEEEESDALGLEATGGVFLVLLAGIIVAYIIVILEFLWNVRNVSVEQHCTFWEAFVSESKFAINVRITKKTTKSESRSSSPGSSRSNKVVITVNGECL